MPHKKKSQPRTKKNKKKTDKNSLPRGGVKQTHVRMQYKNTIKNVSSRKELIAASIRSKTYTSALTTIGKWVASHRKISVPRDKDLEQTFFVSLAGSTTEDDFDESGPQYRAALAWAQRQQQSTVFAAKREVIIAAKGSRKLAQKQNPKSVKGIMSEEQFMNLLNCRQAVEAVQQCSKCKLFSRSHFNFVLKGGTTLQFEGNLRPGELEKLKVWDLVTMSEYCNYTRSRIQQQQMFFAERKNQEHPGFFRVSEQAASAFAELAEGKQPEDFLLPLCIDKHIGIFVQQGAAVLKWHPGVTWVAHGVRSAGFKKMEDSITAAVQEFSAQVVASTYKGYVKQKRVTPSPVA